MSQSPVASNTPIQKSEPAPPPIPSMLQQKMDQKLAQQTQKQYMNQQQQMSSSSSSTKQSFQSSSSQQTTSTINSSMIAPGYNWLMTISKISSQIVHVKHMIFFIYLKNCQNMETNFVQNFKVHFVLCWERQYLEHFRFHVIFSASCYEYYLFLPVHFGSTMLGKAM